MAIRWPLTRKPFGGKEEETTRLSILSSKEKNACARRKRPSFFRAEGKREKQTVRGKRKVCVPFSRRREKRRKDVSAGSPKAKIESEDVPERKKRKKKKGCCLVHPFSSREEKGKSGTLQNRAAAREGKRKKISLNTTTYYIKIYICGGGRRKKKRSCSKKKKTK